MLVVGGAAGAHAWRERSLQRRRRARELHDDVKQQLCALSIALTSLERKLRSDLPDARMELASLQQQALTASETIRQLSHDLHPGVLQHFGLVPALRSSCAEFARMKEIDVAFEAGDSLTEIPADVGLCLYRVVQEALHNTARHANARRVDVSLVSSGKGALELRIADDGRGFDAADPQQRRGLGLMSIDERVRLVGGEVQLRSQPGHGTELRVRVPLQVGGTGSGENEHDPSESAVGGRQRDRRAESGAVSAT